MSWQLVVLVGAIFLAGAIYGAFVSTLAARYLTARDGSTHQRLPVSWKWVGERTSFRLPSRAECSQLSNSGIDGGLRSLCSGLYRN
jgi:hypothetical protein